MISRASVLLIASSLLVPAAIAACVGDEPTPTIVVANEGGSTTDGSTDASLDGGGVPAGLLKNNGFEDDAAQCSRWESTNATLSVDTTARSGARSCRVCTTREETQYFIAQVLPGPFQVGQRYVLSGFLHAPGGGVEAGKSIIPGIATESADLAVLDNVSGAGLSPGDTWRSATVELVINTANADHMAAGFTVQSVTNETGDNCFLVDDTSLELKAE